MRIPTRTMVAACALSAALLAAGCAGTGVKQARVSEPVYLQAAVDRGPEPFTDSTVTDTPRPESPRVTARVQSGDAEAPMRAARTLSGATPGLYRGTPHVAGCDVERHIGYLAADEAKADAFAEAAGVTRSALPGYLRGLTPVVLGADTRVTNHAYRDRRAARYQAVLQAGTAVLVDDRGMPRMRCACGNPLDTPTPTRGGAGARGAAWSGYEPHQVVVVTPAPRAVTSITIVDAETRTWIERPVGHDVRRDHVVPPPASAAVDPTPSDTGPPVSSLPSPQESRSAAAPGRTDTSPAVPDRRSDLLDGVTGPRDGTGVTAAAESPSRDPVRDPSGVSEPPGLLDGAGPVPADSPAVRAGTPAVPDRRIDPGEGGVTGLTDGTGVTAAAESPSRDPVRDPSGVSEPPGLLDGAGPVPADSPAVRAGTPAVPDRRSDPGEGGVTGLPDGSGVTAAAESPSRDPVRDPSGVAGTPGLPDGVGPVPVDSPVVRDDPAPLTPPDRAASRPGTPAGESSG
ncbi:DUF6777 domain-containing protein [Streptomyces sp. NPDC046727]|uniref:DUF6777 domain-containing protein n=1 Tax=Streptomyces sp. NPDC046727 TaxID=3155373 RepID=UPI0033C25F20